MDSGAILLEMEQQEQEVVLTPRLANLEVPFVVFLVHALPFALMQLFLFSSYRRLRRMNAKGWSALALVAFTGGFLGTMAIVKALFLVDFNQLSVVVLLQKLQPLFALSLAAILLGPLAAWITALVPTGLLATTVISTGLENTRREVVMILALNLVALILGELASGLRRQEMMARRRAAVLSAISHSAGQLLEHGDWEEHLPECLEKLGKAADAPALALYQLEREKLSLHSKSGPADNFPEEISVDDLPDEFFRGAILAGSPLSRRGIGQPECLLLPVVASEKLSGGLLVVAPDHASPWTSPVRNALRLAAGLLGAALHRRETEEALARSEERYALAARGSKDGLWDLDVGSGRVFLSDRWYEMLGYSRDGGTDDVDFWMQMIDAEDRPLVERRIQDHLKGTTGQLEVEYRIRHRDGSIRWMLCRGVAVRDSSGRAVRMAGSQTDITYRKETEERILRDAFFDGLTGLPNRALVIDRLGIACRRISESNRHELAVLLMDIDRLKLVNDSYGHQAGDELIRQLAERLEKLSGERRTVARIGSDDFAVLVEEPDATSAATDLHGLIFEELRTPFVIEGHEIYLTLSAGIAACASGRTSAEELLQDADMALAEAKARGRARMVIFEKAMRDSTVRRLSLETELRRALDADQLRIYYQPIVRLSDGELTGFEALLRWENPNRGLMGPGEFIPVAEEAGLIISLGKWALLEACASLNAWRKQFPDRRITTSVNLHSHQFRHKDLVELVSRTLKELQIPSDILRLEVTEQAMMEDQRFAVTLMEELQRLGINLYIDDFGTGYSSLSYLVRLPVSTLKIDQSFIIGMEHDPRKRQMVEVILQLAETLQLDVVAEGIEEPVHLDFLRKRGCRYGQGFLFARPLPLSEATELIASGWKCSI